jgi:hypothetical protein
MDFDEFLQTKGEEAPLSCPCCNQEIDLNKLINHMGLERTYEIANKLLEIINDDFIQAMNENNNN